MIETETTESKYTARLTGNKTYLSRFDMMFLTKKGSIWDVLKAVDGVASGLEVGEVDELHEALET